MKPIAAFLFAILIIACSGNRKNEPVAPPYTGVTVIGEMKNVMWHGQLQGTINLDTIPNKNHLYGFSPLEFLKGEILVLDGRSFQSTIVNDSMMEVKESFQLKAPFFAYANISDWKEYSLPDSVSDLRSLENHLIAVTSAMTQPLLFKLEGAIDSADLHIVNLPEGTEVHSPEDIHRHRVSFPLTNEQVIVVGFYSQNHQAVFTHHDTFLHLHLITENHSKMGHVDALYFNPEKINLFLPE